MDIIIVPSPQTTETPLIPQQVGLGVLMATANRALTCMVFPQARTNAISVVTYATMMALIVIKNNP